MAKIYNPLTQKMEEEADILAAEEAFNDPSASAVPDVSAPTMNPMVKDYISKKYGLGDYSEANRQKLASENQTGMGDKIASILAAAGAGFAGRDGIAAGTSVLDRSKAAQREKLADFDRARATKIQEYDLDRKAKKDEREDESYKREMDPTSQESQMAQELARRMGFKGDASKITAEQFKSFSPALSKIYDIEQKKLDRQEARDERRFQQGIKMDEQKAKLTTPYGLANTEDDAKKLKEAHESKANFDSKIQEMIDLRKKYGGEVYNREAVARGKQLSKDLLLEYKNMAKLGVLSKADEDIINAIIPADPLEFSASSLVGQDPILHQLTKFKEDSDRDFKTRVETRTRGGGAQPLDKKQAAPQKIRVSNGQETLEIDAADLADAEADGYKQVQ